MVTKDGGEFSKLVQKALRNFVERPLDLLTRDQCYLYPTAVNTMAAGRIMRIHA